MMRCAGSREPPRSSVPARSSWAVQRRSLRIFRPSPWPCGGARSSPTQAASSWSVWSPDRKTFGSRSEARWWRVTEIFTIKPDPINDPEGKKLDQVVNAHLAYEHAQRVRSRWLSVLALASGLTWTVGDVSPRVVGINHRFDVIPRYQTFGLAPRSPMRAR